jgi:hypothetical protein
MMLRRHWPFAAALFAVAVAGPVCVCQRAENVEAKARLSKPAPPDPHVKAADDKIDVDKLEDPDAMRRVVHMEGTEIAARLKSFAFNGTGEMQFGRGAVPGVRSMEKTRMEQSSSGDFAVDTVTGDGSEMKLAYVNEVFFLKNNNGKWRIDKDPQGERNTYRTDSVGVWRAFYDLISHGLVVTKLGPGTQNGRSVVKYKLGLPDESAGARSAGASVPVLPDGPDGGPAEETPPEHLKRMKDRMSKWRERAKPAGGNGELWVDSDSGVVTFVRFSGSMVVGDGPDPAKLEVKIDAQYTEIGRDHAVAMPKDAIDEVVRKKMPVAPRDLLEDEGIVAPLPDAGPRKGKKAPAKQNAGEIPDDDSADDATPPPPK